MLHKHKLQHDAKYCEFTDCCGVAGLGRQADRDAATLCRLEQSILPNVTPPRPLDRLMKGEPSECSSDAGLDQSCIKPLADDLAGP